jgi:hypothetical protein
MSMRTFRFKSGNPKTYRDLAYAAQLSSPPRSTLAVELTHVSTAGPSNRR